MTAGAAIMVSVDAADLAHWPWQVLPFAAVSWPRSIPSHHGDRLRARLAIVDPRWSLAPTGAAEPAPQPCIRRACYPCAIKRMKKAGELWRFAKLPQAKYLNNIVEQDHRRIKRMVRPGMGFGSFHTAQHTIIGYEIIAMVHSSVLLPEGTNRLLRLDRLRTLQRNRRHRPRGGEAGHQGQARGLRLASDAGGSSAAGPGREP
jgi:DDE domain